VNLKTAARRLGVHYQTAYRWVRGGQLVAVKVGAGYEISEAALELFHAQRDALQQMPDSIEPAPIDLRLSREQSLIVLDRMVAAVTVDAGPVVDHAARLAADVLGDGAVCALRNDDGEFDFARAAHCDPVIGVTVATLARDSLLTDEIVDNAVATGETIFFPQVPQRVVRRFVPRELHELLQSVGCYSLICAPVLVDHKVEGSLLVVRNAPGRPYERDDVAFVEAIAARVARAHERAQRGNAAWAIRRRVIDSISGAVEEHATVETVSRETLDEILEWAVADDPDRFVALLDLDLRHLACSKPYAELLSQDPRFVRGAELSSLVAETEPVAASFSRLLSGEVDFRTVRIDPIAAPTPLTLHAAMVRRVDATPWCVVVVAHTSPPAVCTDA
jgi:excisionase family DNA binding protein